MELREANRILQSVKSALAAERIKLPSAVETDGIMLLLGKYDIDKYLAPKIARARISKTAADGNIVFCRALRSVKTGLKSPITPSSICELHKALFGDTDIEAGKLRTSQSSDKDGNAHADPKYISGSLKSIISKMNGTPPAPIIGKEDFASYITHYMRELIILHPFERGSEITLRIFMIVFCRLKGFALCYNRVPSAAVKNAEDIAFRSDDVSPLYKVLGSCLSYERTTVSPPAPKPREKSVPAHAGKAAKPRSPHAEIAAVKLGEESNVADMDDAKLRRIIRLQQKISKLNEQLMNELAPKNVDSDK